MPSENQTTRQWPIDYPFRGCFAVNGACFVLAVMTITGVIIWVISRIVQNV